MEWMQRMLASCETNNGLGQTILWDDKWNPTFNDDNGIAMAEHYRDLMNQYGPPGVAGMTWGEVRSLMFAGETAIIGMAWNTWALRFENPKDTPYAGKFAWAPAPTKTGCPRGCVGGMRPLYLNTASKNKQAALEVMRWATSKEADLDQGLTLTPSVIRKSTLQHPGFKKKYPESYVDNLFEVFKNASPEPIIPEWPEIKEHLGLALSQILTKSKAAKETLDIAAKEVEHLLARSGYYK
jgi:ABC-type glycerol-3-phosphate transport system substrate-binding protein